MPEMSVENYLRKLVFLEKNAGHKVQYHIMEPPTNKLRDTIALQEMAKLLATYIGLTNITFIISVSKQKENVGGHIDLSRSSGNDVFIEVDAQIMESADMAIATLCHEICHKWLQAHGLEMSDKAENEILTDITSVFLGFGKIMLNGCKISKEKYEVKDEGTTTTTHTKTVGYLSRDDFAFVYRMVCAMRKIEQAVYLEGISLESLAAVQRSDISYGHLYEQNFHSSDVSNLLLTRFMEQTAKSQRNIADLNKHATYIKKRFCECIDDFISSGHNSLDTFASKFQQQNNAPDPALRFLCAVEKTFDFKKMSEEITSIDHKSAELIQISKSVCSSLAQDNWNLNLQSPSWFNVVSCPKDGTKLRLPENSGDLVVTCPTCKYKFPYNTSEMTFDESESLLRKLKKLF